MTSPAGTRYATSRTAGRPGKAAQPIARGDAVLDVLDLDDREGVLLSPGHHVQIGPLGGPLCHEPIEGSGLVLGSGCGLERSPLRYEGAVRYRQERASLALIQVLQGQARRPCSQGAETRHG